MSLLVDSTLRISVILLLALIASTLIRHHSAAVRHWVLAAAIVCAAVLPVFGQVIPAWYLPVRISGPVQPLGRPLPSIASAETRPVVPVEGEPLAALDHLLLSLWAVGTGVGLSALVAGLTRLARLASHAERVREGPWRELADDIARRYGLNRRVLLLQGSQPTLLAAWGLVQPKILLPAAASVWTEDRMRVVLAHELAHIQREDWLTQMLAEVLRSIYWFNPLVWIAGRRLRRESEHACDDAVLTLGIEPSTYAAHVAALARALNRRYAVSLGIARPSSLEQRIAAMLNATLNRRPISRSARMVVAGTLLSATLSIAAVRGSAQAASVFSGFVFDQTGVGVPDVTLTLSRASNEPALHPASNRPLSLRFTKASVFDVINFPMKVAGIRVSYDPGVTDRPITLQLDGVTIRQALDCIMATSRLSYKVVDEQSILVFPDPGNAPYEAHSDRTGNYQFDTLAPGNYFLQVQVPGFNVSQDNVTLPAGQSVRRDITLQLGSVTERYTLDETAAASLAESKDARLVQQQVERLRGERLQPPIMVKRTALQYPQSLRGSTVGSRVIVEGRIGTDGFLSGLRILTDIDPILQGVVLDGVRQWQWEPTRLNGIPVEVPITVTIDFVPTR